MEESAPVKKTVAMRRVTRPEDAIPPVNFLQLLSGRQAGLLWILEQPRLLLGRDEQCDIMLDEIGVSREHAVLLQAGDDYEILDEDSTNGTFVNGVPAMRLVLRNGDTIELGPACSLRFGRQRRSEVELAQRLFEGARLDGLTRVYNRATFFECLEQELAFSERHDNLGFSLLLFDIDLFKSVNDTYGHPAGDEVLAQVANAARGLLRLEDTLGRYGGEEFAIILRATDRAGAEHVAERLLEKIARTKVDVGDVRISVTVSIGLSVWKIGVSGEELLAQADQAMYSSKRNGRNQVSTYEA